MKNIYFLLFLLAIVSCKPTNKNMRLSGPIFGTSYDVTYNSSDNENFQKEFDSLFYVINKSMSNYQTNSDISKLNRHEIDSVDNHFVNVFKAAKIIYKNTKGVFDPTIGNLVNAWNFGSEKNKTRLDSTKIDSLMFFVGFNRLLLKNNIIIKQYPRAYIDFNAIAKGYSVDVIAKFLEEKNVKDYMVNIGGELRTKGENLEKESGWTVGIENPNFDGTQSYDKVFVLKDKAMATSGTYRKFKLDENGNRYAHIINTKTGYPTRTNILSASVIADDCIMADGYATAFQAMGVKKVTRFMSEHPELKAFLIFENEKQELETLALNDFPLE